MSDAMVKELMAKLHAALASVDRVDPELMSLVHELDGDIHRLLQSGTADVAAGSMLGRAAALETRFATTHPRAEQLLREIVDALGKMGV